MIGHRAPRTLAIAASVVMAVAVIAGLVVLGSPAHQRQLRLDRIRVADLSLLRSMVSMYWERNHALPPNLGALDLPANRRDPVSGEPYGYVVTGKRSYRLCADFDLPSSTDDPGQRWPGALSTHPSGRYCVDQTVGPP